MKKVIHLIVPDRFKNPLGGMGVGARHFIDALKKDFDFYVVGFPEENDIENYAGAYNPLPMINHGSLVTLFSQGSYALECLKLPKPDLIHVYDWSIYMGAWQVAEYFQVPLIVSMRLSVNLLSDMGISYVSDKQSGDGFWIDRALREMEIMGLKKATHITQVSNAYAKKFEMIEGLSGKTTVVPNGIDLKEWGSFEKVELPGKARIKLVYIGRFVSMKGVVMLCQANIPDDIDLIFIGSEDGSERFIFETMLRKVADCENVHYVGAKYGQDKINYLNSADAVIIPSRHEPFGIVALEALASKNILLSSYVDGMSDFLNDEVAINCGTTSREIENALEKLVNLKEEEKKNLIDQGIRVCQEYSWENASNKLKEVYEKVINSQKPVS